MSRNASALRNRSALIPAAVEAAEPRQMLSAVTLAAAAESSDGHDHADHDHHDADHDHEDGGHDADCQCGCCGGGGHVHGFPVPTREQAEELGAEYRVRDLVTSGRKSDAVLTAAAAGPLTVPALDSLPGADQTIFLDFDGHVVADTYWNSRNSGNPIHAQPYSTDTDVFSFSATDLQRIEQIWKRVAEDFAPFDVNVSTVEPPSFDGGEAIRVLISTDVDSAEAGGTGNRWYSGAGGVAYLNSFNWDGDTPVWVFENNLGNGNAKYVAEAASHEAGHALRLRHDGRTEPSEGYYRGHGSGATGWASIMGVGYYKPLSQWNDGSYLNANETEDDVAIIASQLGFRTDDHGGFGGATVLDVGGATPGQTVAVTDAGVISTRDDVDAFTFETAGGAVSLDLTAFEEAAGYANLDILATLLDAAGSVVAVSNPADALGAAIDVTLAAGTYTLTVDGTGKGDPLGTGYTDYGSLGQYTLNATFPAPGDANADPTAVDDVASTLQLQPKRIAVLANDSDADGDSLSLTGIVQAPPSDAGTAAVDGDDIVFTPAAGFAGIATFRYAVSDGNGGTAEADVVITVDNVGPTAGDDAISVESGSAAFAAVLANDSDAGGDTLTARLLNGPANGTATPQGDGFLYTSDAGYVGGDSFVYEVSDGNGGTATATVSVTVTPVTPQTAEIGEAGSVTFTQQNSAQWVTVQLDGTYQNPVVVAGPVEDNGGQAAVARVRNVTANSFEIQVDEWDHLDGYHIEETIGYLVVEAGRHELAGGVVLEAGVADVTDAWSRVGLSAGFVETPVVLSSVGGVNDATAVTTRQRRIDAGGFDIRLQEQEANDRGTTGAHAAEPVHWIAMSLGAGETDADGGAGRFSVGHTGDVVTHRRTRVDASPAAAVPNAVVLAGMQSFDGGDTAAVRYGNLAGSSFDVFIDEDQSRDTERSHTTETVGFAVFSAGRLSAVVPTGTAAFASTADAEESESKSTPPLIDAATLARRKALDDFMAAIGGGVL